MDFKLVLADDTFSAQHSTDGITIVRNDGDPVSLSLTPQVDGSISVHDPRGAVRGYAVRDGDAVWVRLSGRTYRFEISRGGRAKGARGGGSLASPMPGQMQKHLVVVGSAVEAGQALAVVEAMKMQLEIKAPHAGTVTAFLAAEGEQVAAGAPLVAVEKSE